MGYVMRTIVYSYLCETDLSSSLTEALSADVKSVLADDGVAVCANAAKRWFIHEGDCKK